MRILVFGGWFGSRNAGDEAILLGLRKMLEGVFPGCLVYAHSIDPDYTRSVTGVEAVSAPRGGSFLGKAWHLVRAYRSMDLIVVSGGTPIFDYRLLSRAFHFLVPIASAIPIAFVGVGLKPVRSRRGKWFYRLVCGRAVYFSARDPEVVGLLAEMGVTRTIELTADSAIVMAPAPVSAAEASMAAQGIDLDRPIVAMAPIVLSSDYKGHYHEPVSEERRRYAYESMARAADHQIDQGRQVVFIPMHQVPPDDDREVIAVIRERMRGQAVSLEHAEDPRVVAALLRRSDMLIGMRLHSLVLATAGGVPSVAIGFDMKVGGFMRYLGMGDYCLPIEQFTADQLVELSERCWHTRIELRAHLVTRMHEWRGVIDSSVVRMAATVRTHRDRLKT